MNKNSFIPVNQPLLDGNEKKYLLECVTSGWISSEGPFVKRFEDQFSRRVERQYGVAVTNGTAALDVAIEALGISTGDEVILPTFTIISCINQIIRCGAKPVFVDSDPLTWNMAVTDIEAKITPKTKAIMMVHIYGLPVDVAPVLKLAKEHRIYVLEDAAEAIGQTYHGSPCGGFGDVSVFSFYPNKHVTTGEGGMVVTNSPTINQESKSLRNLYFGSKKRFVHENIGWNLRMTNMQAAIGLAQLESLDRNIKKKVRMGRLYTELLDDIGGISLPVAETEYAENNYWVFGIVLDKSRDTKADLIMQKLFELGVGTRPFFHPMHMQPVLTKRGLTQNQNFPVAEHLGEYGFYVPSGLTLSDSQIEYVAESIRKVLT